MSPLYYHFELKFDAKDPDYTRAYFYAFPLENFVQNQYCLNKENIYAFLEKAGIVFGIQEQAIQEILQQGFAQHVCIAQGLLPLEGPPGSFECLVPQNSQSLDFTTLRDLQDCVIPVNHPVLRKIPARRGAPGLNIKGQIIWGKKGLDRPFPAMRELYYDKQTSCLKSALAGIPHLKLPEYLEILPLHIMRQDVKTSLFFKGILAVEGNVLDFVRLHAQGGLYIWGSVGASVLTSQGNIWIKEGIIGKEQAVIKSGQNLSVSFAEQATLESGQNILCQSLTHCHSSALLSITADKIIGGETLCYQSISVKTAGGKHGPCILSCGSDALINAEIRECEKAIDSLYIRQMELLELKAHTLNLELYRLNQTHTLNFELAKRKSYLLHLKERGPSIPFIQISKHIYSASVIRIQEHEVVLEDDLQEDITFTAGKFGILQHILAKELL